MISEKRRLVSHFHRCHRNILMFPCVQSLASIYLGLLLYISAEAIFAKEIREIIENA